MSLDDFSPICGSETPSFFIFDFSVAPPLLFYSYIPIVITTLILAVLILKKDNYSLRSKLFFGMSISFALWTLNILVQWISSYHTSLLFAWQLTALFEVSLFVFALYFFLVYLRNGTDISIGTKWLLSVPYFLVAILTPTTLNIAQYDIESCEGVVGVLWSIIYYGIEPLIITLIAIAGLRSILNKKNIYAIRKKELTLMTLGLVLFLFVFHLSNVAGELTKTYEINLIGPLGMLIFLLILSYLIVKFQAFSIKLFAAQALVFTLWFMIGSLLFVVRSPSSRVVASITLVLAVVGGYFLIRSVRHEINQREQIAKLAKSLQQANERLKELDKMKSEFVSIASHQLRSPLTSIRGYASMLLEGSFGKLPTKANEVIEKIADSSKYMALSIEDYLNVSRIEAGNMKYEMSDFSLRDTAERIVDELRPVAIKKGVVLVFRSDCNGSCMVHADIGKMRQIIMNLLDNSLKYTPKGTITVVVKDDPKKKLIDVIIQDTGVGMSAETLEGLFDKFVRAKNANNINVTGTGLGLFVARQMASAMDGCVWAESEGEGKGSAFHIRFPLLPGKPKPVK